MAWIKNKKNWGSYQHKNTIPRHEREFVVTMLDMIENDPVRYRLSNLIIWYIDHAEKNKTIYYLLSIITFLSNIMIPVVNVLGTKYHPLVINAWLAAAASLALAFNAMGHFKDNWTRYRVAAEELKELMAEYLTKLDECKQRREQGVGACSVDGICVNESGAYHCPLTSELMEAISHHINKENREWKAVFEQDNKGRQKGEEGGIFRDKEGD